MTETVQHTSAAVVPGEISGAWLARFGAALEEGNFGAVEGLFLSDGWWRDLLAFTWDLRTFSGSQAIAGAFKSTLAAVRPSRFNLAPGKNPVFVEPAPGMRWVQAFFDFETAVGRGVGFLRLMPAGTEPGALEGVDGPHHPRRTEGF